MNPVNAGAVTATLTLTGADFNVAEISVSYEIAKAEHSFGGISDKELFCGGCGGSSAKGSEPMLFGGALTAILGAAGAANTSVKREKTAPKKMTANK